MNHTQIDENLKTWASERQGQYIEATNRLGSMRAAAKELGVTENSVRDSMRRLAASASIRGYSPDHAMIHPVPETHVAKGVSTYWNKDGVPSGQWVKSDLRQEAYNQVIKDAMAAFVEDLPQLPMPDGPRDYSTDVIPWIQIGDAHIGMLAHAAEVGENFDVKIGERELCAAIGMLLDEMPPTERLVINDLGDFTHYENFTATTEASGHALDYDSRFPKMIKAYARIMRFIIEKALTKAKIVDLIINQGNHSRTNDIWSAVMLDAVYTERLGRDEPLHLRGKRRVNVLNNDSVFIGYRMGNTFVMTHHSDKCRPERLPAVMTSDFKRDFGETDFHYIDIGHVHHSSVSKDISGIVVESWNHLAASDKWAHEAGYRSSKSISVVLRSRTYGEIGRRHLPIAEVRDRLYGLGHKTPTKKPAFTV